MNNNLKVVLRNLLKFKLFTLINFLGIFSTMVVAIVIIYMSWHDLNIDGDVKDASRVYRLLQQVEGPTTDYRSSPQKAHFKEMLELDLSQLVDQTVRVLKSDELISAGQKRFFEDNFYYTDNGFFEIFQFEFSQGNPSTALIHPNSVVLTARMAKKYFGGQNPLDQSITIEEGHTYKVTGVLKEASYKSHLKFDFIGSIESSNLKRFLSLGHISAFDIYLKLKPDAGIAEVASLLGGQNDRYFRNEGENVSSFQLQPLKSIYFESDVRYDDAIHKNRRVIHTFIVIALTIVLLACANFINLTQATIVHRRTSISIRKILGSTNGQIISQFLVESAVVVWTAIGLAVICGYFLVNYLNNQFDLDLPLTVNWEIVLQVILMAALLTALCGISPAILALSSSRVPGLRSQQEEGTHHTPLSLRFLLVFQFTISAVLIIYTIVVQQQMEYIRQKDIGFNSSEILVFHSNNRESYMNKKVIKQRLINDPNIQEVSIVSGGIPGLLPNEFNLSFEGVNDPLQWKFALIEDYDFIEVIGLKLLEGRDFARSFSTDRTDAVILNETAVKELGLKPNEAIGKKIKVDEFGFAVRKVIGVVKDYHDATFKEAIEPLVIMLDDEWGESFLVKVSSENMSRTIKAISSVWYDYSPKYPLSFNFLYDGLDAMYKSDQRHMHLLMIFSGLAILIATLEVFGLSLFFAQRRIKEITIRKVLGASGKQLVVLLIKQFVVLMSIALIISWPIAWWLGADWISNFSYRIVISPFYFVGGSLMLITFVLLIAGLQSSKVVFLNPVKHLKSE